MDIPRRPLHRAMKPLWILAVATLCFDYTVADCECGYAIKSDGGRAVFSDLLESDFVHLDVTDRTQEYGKYGWAAQAFDMTKEEARGPYGELFTLDNVVSSTIPNAKVFDQIGNRGGDAGLHLSVGSKVVNGMVTSAEMSTTDLHFFYGTFRAGMKLTDVPGTCSAFFWYFSDTQEIDIEFLSAQYNQDNGSFPVNLVLQSAESNDAGFDASNTDYFRRVNLPFNPTTDFHEYRFDFLPREVIFYADGKELTRMNGSAVPRTPGHLLLSHWSNGNPGWSKGPPTSDATTTVSYVKAYYNSSLDSRRADYSARCHDPTSKGAICDVPNNDARYFFTYHPNKAVNQTTYTNDEDDENAAGQLRMWWPWMLGAALVSSAWITTL